MRALRLAGYGEPLVVEEVPVPEPGPGEVLVRISAAGVCHSDLHIISGQMPLLPSLPWTLGHENTGIVAALGPGCSGVESGEPVAVFGGWGCGRCRLCLGGVEQLCNLLGWVGVGRPGGFAEYLLVPAARHLLPLGGLDPVAAAPLTDAGLTPYRAVKRALPRLVPGATALVVGVGGLGHYAVQLLELLSPARIVAVDPVAGKRALAEELGAEVTLDSTSVDVAAEARAMTGGEGVDVVLDLVGSDATLALAAACVARRGLVVVVGLAGGTLPVTFMGVGLEAEVTTSVWGSRNDLAELLELARGGHLAGRVESHPLDDANKVFERLERGEIEGRAVLCP